MVEVLKKEQGYTDSHFPGWVTSVGMSKTRIMQPKKRAPAPQITEEPVDDMQEDIPANVESVVKSLETLEPVHVEEAEEEQ